MVKKCLFENQFTTNINDITSDVRQESFTIDETTASIDCLTVLIQGQKWLTTRVHLDITDDAIDVKAGEGEDLWELTIIL